MIYGTYILNTKKFVFILLFYMLFTILGCRKADSSIASEENTEYATCYWYERCSPEELQKYPGGDLVGCIETNKCLKAHHDLGTGDSASSKECRQLIENASCEIGDLKEILSSYPCRIDKVIMGESCNDNPRNCNSDLACLPEDTDRTKYSCQEPLEINEQCLDSDMPEWQIDVNPNTCGNERFCSKDTYRCAKKLETGAPCISPTQCKSDRCASTGICIPLGKLGDDCTYQIDCEEMEGLFCINGTCQVPRNVGEACAITTSLVGECKTGLVCVEGICTKVPCRPAGLGEPCFAVCENRLYCNYQTNTCTKEATAGQSCDVDLCEQGLFCNDKLVCESEKQIDAGCARSEECNSGYCRDGGCSAE